MRVSVYGSPPKCQYLADRLGQAGVKIVVPEQAQIILVDTDSPLGGAHECGLLAYALKHGIPVCLIPHGANPQLEYDGLRDADYPVRVDFVHGPGHKRLHEAYGYPRRVEVVGWTYGPVSRWAAAQGPYVESILFCPLHPRADGVTILPQHQAANEQAYNAFLNLKAAEKTVRLLGADQPNGITHRVQDVTYLADDGGAADFQPYDAVLGYGTNAYAALAAGKRTVMFGSDLPDMDDFGNPTFHGHDYRYPYDIADGDLADLYQQPFPQQWVDDYVGGPLDVRHMKRVLSDLLLPPSILPQSVREKTSLWTD